MNETLVEFFNFINKEVDYEKTSIFIESGRLNLALIINNLNYDSTCKYIELAKEIINYNGSNINILMYDDTEEKDILEALKNSNIDFFELKGSNT